MVLHSCSSCWEEEPPVSHIKGGHTINKQDCPGLLCFLQVGQVPLDSKGCKFKRDMGPCTAHGGHNHRFQLHCQGVAAPGEWPLVWDCRPLDEGSRTKLRQPGQDREAALLSVQVLLRRNFNLAEELRAHTLFFTDSTGSLPQQLPDDLQQVQFVRVNKGPRSPHNVRSAVAGRLPPTGIMEPAVLRGHPRIVPAAPMTPRLRLVAQRGPRSQAIDCPADYAAIDHLLHTLLLQHDAEYRCQRSLDLFLQVHSRCRRVTSKK